MQVMNKMVARAVKFLFIQLNQITKMYKMREKKNREVLNYLFLVNKFLIFFFLESKKLVCPIFQIMLLSTKVQYIQQNDIGLQTSIGLLTVCLESFHSSDAAFRKVSTGIGGPFRTTLNDSFWCNPIKRNVSGMTFTERPSGAVTLAL